jgi:hypothetical protein
MSSIDIKALPHAGIAAAIYGEDAIRCIEMGLEDFAAHNAKRAASYAFAYVPRDYGEKRFINCPTLEY